MNHPQGRQKRRLTHAAFSVGFPCVAQRTDTHVCADEVLTSHATTGTVIYAVLTLVLVWNTETTC